MEKGKLCLFFFFFCERKVGFPFQIRIIFILMTILLVSVCVCFPLFFAFPLLNSVHKDINLVDRTFAKCHEYKLFNLEKDLLCHTRTKGIHNFFS